MKKYNVIIVDDHLLLSRSLATLINDFSNYEVSEIFGNGAEFVDQISSGMEDPDILILDVKMPVMDGIATMKWIKKYRPFLKVIVVSMEDDETTVLSLIKNGAKGYLLKDTHPDILLKALNNVAEGGYFHTDIVTSALMHNLEGEIKNNKFELKENEMKFIKLACEEKTYGEIAEEMMLSPKTVDGYRQRIFDLFNVKNRIGLMIFAIKNKLIEI